MSSGTIRARTYTSAAQIPVENAGVGVTQKLIDMDRLIGFQFTDENGLTEAMTVETPDMTDSQNPGGVKPFAVCNVKVAHPAYETVEVENVQVFPNVETVQDVELIPLEEYPTLANEMEVFNVTPQNL